MAFITIIPVPFAHSSHHRQISTTFAPPPVLLPRSPSPASPAPAKLTPVHASLTPAPASSILPSPSSKALIFDCDGVIVESEELHRIAYNQCWAAEGLDFEWSVSFYEMLQNSIGGGREKMRWYFNKYGWPEQAPDESSQQVLLDRLVQVKTGFYKKLIHDGKAQVRDGVLRLMDQAYDRGLKLAICSAANREAVQLVLDRLVGEQRLKKFDLIIAGDMVQLKKPNPMIYKIASEKLNVQPQDCVVIEDSAIGLQAGVEAGMRVVITYTPYTKSQDFSKAVAVYDGLGNGISVDDLFPELASVTA